MKLRSIVLTTILAALSAGSAASAQSNPFYDAPDEQLAAELRAWSGMLWQYKNTGTPAQGAGAFAYSNAILNSPLFSPAVAATKTVASIAGSDGCVGRIDEGVITVDATLEAKTELYMTLGVLETDLYTDPADLTAHLQAIMEALSVTAVQVWVEDDKLISSGIPVKPVEQAAGSPGLLTNPSEETWAHVLALGGAAQAAAAAQDLSSSPTRALLGQRPFAAEFAENIAGFLEFTRQSNASVTRIDARFGRFGSLPLLEVDFADAFVLVDAINGNIAGPFEAGTAFDASSLLQMHSEYVAATPVVYLNSGGCTQPVAGKWHNGPPCWFCSPTITWNPPGPTGLTWFCTSYSLWNGASACVCTRFGTITIGTPPVTYQVREECWCGAPGPPCGGGWTTGTPPAGCSPCHTQYYY